MGGLDIIAPGITQARHWRAPAFVPGRRRGQAWAAVGRKPRPRRGGAAMTGEPRVTLESLDFEWGDAYLICYARDQWAALRRDTHRFLAAAHPGRAGHHDRSRLHGIPGAARLRPARHSGLPQRPDDGEDPDEDDAPGEGEGEAPGRDGERLELLMGLRAAFPHWNISYSPFSRAWTARKDGATICQNTPALLCIALTLIERKERQARNGPGWNWPPWGHVPPS